MLHQKGEENGEETKMTNEFNKLKKTEGWPKREWILWGKGSRRNYNLKVPSEGWQIRSELMYWREALSGLGLEGPGRWNWGRLGCDTRNWVKVCTRGGQDSRPTFPTHQQRMKEWSSQEIKQESLEEGEETRIKTGELSKTCVRNGGIP